MAFIINKNICRYCITALSLLYFNITIYLLIRMLKKKDKSLMDSLRSSNEELEEEEKEFKEELKRSEENLDVWTQKLNE